MAERPGRRRHHDITEIIPVVSEEHPHGPDGLDDLDDRDEPDGAGESPADAEDPDGAGDNADNEAGGSADTGADEEHHDPETGTAGRLAARARALAATALQVLAALLARLVGAAGRRLARLGVATVPRIPRLTTTAVAGLLLCAAFPPWNWWWAAVIAFALLSWVLIRPETTVLGGLGYGLLFGLVFYVPLLPWISGLVGAVPWLALALVCAMFPALFGLGAAVVRHLPGWPVWFAVLWATQEWLKSIFPFGGFPWGVVGFSQTDSPLLALTSLGGVPLLSTAVVLVGCSATVIALEIGRWWRQDRAQRSEEHTSE